MMTVQIELYPYDADWPRQFQEIGAALRDALGDTALRIDHIGSTAIPKMDAKPIIDIQISVRDFFPVDQILAPMQRAGYVWQDDNDDLTKRYFRESPGMPSTHIHMRRAGSWSEQFALLFRDYLRATPDAAGRYMAEKHRLADMAWDSRDEYAEAKGPVIFEIMHGANGWSQATGWMPGPSDA